MEKYYPSEIARLVLGYLDEVKCKETWHIFLEESGDLHEHKTLLERGENVWTNVRGESLLDILKTYCVLKSLFEEIICQYSWKDILDDITYLQEHYNIHKQKSCNSSQKTGQSIVDSLKRWISKISSAQSDDQSFLQHAKHCQKTNDKNVQTDLPTFVQISGKEPTFQSINTSEKRNEQLDNYIINSTSDQEGIQNKLASLSSVQQGMIKISEANRNDASANKKSCEKSPSNRLPCLLISENNEKEKLEKQNSPQGENCQVKRNLFKDSSISISLHTFESPSKSNSCEDVCFIARAGHSIELPETEKITYGKSDCPDSNFSSNIYSNEIDCTDIQNQKYSFAGKSENADGCAKNFHYNFNSKETVNQIVNETRDSAVNALMFQEIPSDNNSSFVNSEHDLQIVENESDCHSEGNTNDEPMVVAVKAPNLYPLNNIPLESSDDKNKSFSIENNTSPEKEKKSAKEVTEKILDHPLSVDITHHSAENQMESSDTEITNNTEEANQNSEIGILSNEISKQNTLNMSEEHDNSKANKDASTDATCAVAKSVKKFDSVCNSQNSTVISPPNQSNAIMSYTTIPEFTMSNVLPNLSGQNNIQYQLVLNTPCWNVPVANGLSLVSSQTLPIVSPLLPQQTVFTPAKITAIPNSPLPKVAKKVAFTSSSSTVVLNESLPNVKETAFTLASETVVPHVASIETVTSINQNENAKSVSELKTKAHQTKDNSSKQAIATLKKQKTEKKEDGKNLKSTSKKRSYSKRYPKRKPLCLFACSPKSKELPPEKVPVLSISESPCNLSSSSATEVITKITDEFEEQYKSPVLKLLMTGAKKLLKRNSTSDLSHVRCLDFNSKSTEHGATDDVLIHSESNKLQESKNKQNCENVPKRIVNNEILNEKSLINDHVQNVKSTSITNHKLSNNDENNKKVHYKKRNKETSSDKKTKTRKNKKEKKDQNKKKKVRMSSKSKDAKKVESCSSLKKVSKMQKKMKIQENLTMLIHDKMDTSPGKTKQKCNDVFVKETNSISPQKLNVTHDRENTDITNNIVSVDEKCKFQVKTYENFNKEKDEVMEVSDKNNFLSQNEEMLQKTFIEKNIQKMKSPRKSNEEQNKICSLNQSPRRFQRKFEKMTLTSAIGVPVFEVAVTDKNILPLQKENEIHSEIFKSKQNIESPRKSDRLQNKKIAKNKDNCKSLNVKVVSLNENKDQIIDERSITPSSHEINESSKESIDAQNIVLSNSQESIDIIHECEIDKPLDINRNNEIIIHDKNIETLQRKNKIKSIIEKDSKKVYSETIKEPALKNISVLNELNKESLVKINELQNEDNTFQIKKNELLKRVDMPKRDNVHKPLKESSDIQKVTKNSKISVSNINDKNCKQFDSVITFNNRCELNSVLNINQNSGKEIEAHKCKDVILNDDCTKLKEKIVFHDHNFKLQSVNEDEQMCDVDTFQKNSKVQTSNEKDKSKTSPSRKSLIHLKNVKETNKQNLTSAINLASLVNLKKGKGFKNIISCTTVLNKRKMTHPKKRIQQDYFDVCDMKEDTQENIEEIKQHAFLSNAISPVLESIDSGKFSNSNLEFDSNQRSDFKVIENVPGINLMDNKKNSKKDESSYPNTNISKPSVCPSKILEENTDEFNLDVNTKNILNKINSSKGNLKEKYATDVLQPSISKQFENNGVEKGKKQTEKSISIPSSLNINCKEAENNQFSIKCNAKSSGNTSREKQEAYYVTENYINNSKSLKSPSLSSKQIIIDLSDDHSSSDTFHSISSNSNEESLVMPQDFVSATDKAVIDIASVSCTTAMKRKLNSELEEEPEKFKCLDCDSPLSNKKRTCRKLSSSSDEIIPSSKNILEINKKNPYLNKAVRENVKTESLKLSRKNVINKQNLKLNAMQDSPVRSLKKVKKIHPKTALSKRIEKDPRIPAGVKIPYKWNNSKIITYSNEICQSSKNIRKNVNKNICIEANEEQEISSTKQISKPIEDKINNDKQNLLEELPTDCKLNSEPCVVLTKLMDKDTLNVQHPLKENVDQNTILDADCEQIAKTISEVDTEVKITCNPKNSTSFHSIPSQDVIEQFENTQDMVEADIGKSNDENSELAVAIKNCEKELHSSKSIHPSESPVKISTGQSKKKASHLEINPTDHPEKKSSDFSNNPTNELEKNVTDLENNPKMEIILSLAKKYGTKWVLEKLKESAND